MSDAVFKARALVANESKKIKKTGGDPSAVQEAKRLLAEEKIKAYVEATVASAPQLTSEQLGRLAGLFQGGAQ